jgi:hypothetical protein
VALAKQRVTSPSELIALRKLQLQQVGIPQAVNWKLGPSMLSILLAGETESGYNGVAFGRYCYAYDGDPPRRSTLCARSTCGARCASIDSNHPI